MLLTVVLTTRFFVGNVIIAIYYQITVSKNFLTITGSNFREKILISGKFWNDSYVR